MAYQEEIIWRVWEVPSPILSMDGRGLPSFLSFQLEKVVGLTGFVITHVFIASFSPVQGERSQMVNI